MTQAGQSNSGGLPFTVGICPVDMDHRYWPDPDDDAVCPAPGCSERLVPYERASRSAAYEMRVRVE